MPFDANGAEYSENLLAAGQILSRHPQSASVRAVQRARRKTHVRTKCYFSQDGQSRTARRTLPAVDMTRLASQRTLIPFPGLTHAATPGLAGTLR